MSETPNFKDLDTAALIDAAETLMVGITPGTWQWNAQASDDGWITYRSLISDHKRNFMVIDIDGGEVLVDDVDAAFIAAAPDLVLELVARLRKYQNPESIGALKNGDTLNIQYRTDGEQIDPDSVVVRKNPPSAKFKVNDRVQPKWWPDNTLEEWKAGTILTVYEAHWDNVNGYWSYIVSDDIIVRGTTEDNLELFKE